MKILFIADVPILNPISGSETVLHQESKYMVESGSEIYAITRSNEGETEIDYRKVDGVREACYRVNINNTFKFFFTLFSRVKDLYNEFSAKTPFDIVICHQPFTCFSLLLKKKFSTIPLIYVFHSPNHIEYQIIKGFELRWYNYPQIQIRKMIEGYCLKKSIARRTDGK